MQCFSYQLIGRFFLIESEYFIKFRPNFCLVQKYPGAQILCAEAIFQVFLYSKREYLSTEATGDAVLDPFLSALVQPHRAILLSRYLKQYFLNLRILARLFTGHTCRSDRKTFFTFCLLK